MTKQQQQDAIWDASLYAQIAEECEIECSWADDMNFMDPVVAILIVGRINTLVSQSGLQDEFDSRLQTAIADIDS
ncbi:MAG: hypothetical protein AAGF24_09085 [Cyanobacteria bacterium P01_H01_bin.121]